MKNYQGELKRGKKINKEYRFSDEREWRYVPTDKNIDLVIDPDKFQRPDQKKAANDKLKDLRLEFTPDDITYIIIKDETEINDFINILRSTKGKTYTQEQVERLITRIFTTQQIKDDI